LLFSLILFEEGLTIKGKKETDRYREGYGYKERKFLSDLNSSKNKE